jgi:hypothetical protein
MYSVTPTICLQCHHHTLMHFVRREFWQVSLIVNQRFVFTPAVVAFPTTLAQVFTIVQTTVKYKKHVSTQGGGISKLK